MTMLAKTPMQQAWDLIDIAAKAEAKIVTMPAAAEGYEMAEGEEAKWYLVRTFPGDDNRALRWLARRRFGAFSPQQQRRLKNRGGQLVQGWESVFPGWLFVLCSNIDEMRVRIESCPGVMGLFCYPGTCKPVPIGQAFIDEVMALSWVYNDRAPRAGHAAASGARHARRLNRATLGRKERKELHRLKDQVTSVGIWDQEAWQRANELEPGKRIALLKATLVSLAASGGSASLRT